MAQVMQDSAPDITKYYRALEQADAAGDTAGATEIAGEIKRLEGAQNQGPQKETPLQITTPTQQRNAQNLQQVANINPIESAKNLGKGIVSLADQGIEGVSQLGSQVLQPVVRPFTSAQRAKEIAAPVQAPLGRALGIENDPAYKAEALRRGTQFVGEKVAPYAQAGIQKVSEVTGLPEEDVANMAANASLAIPGIGIGKLKGKPLPSELRAQALRDIEAANKIPDVDEATLRTPVKPILEPKASVTVEQAPTQVNPNAKPLGPNDIPAAPSAVSPEQARANMLARGLKQANEAPLESTMSGVGSADIGKMNFRTQTAESLPVPVNLTKGKRTQELDFLQEENKLRYAHGDEPAGRALLHEDALNNERFRQNVDSLIDDVIGSANPKDRVAFGESLNTDFRNQLGTKMGKANSLYQKAENSPEINKKLDAAPLIQYIGEQSAPIRKQAPILDVVESLIDEKGKITLGDLMEVRKVVSKASRAPDTNSHYASKLKGQIDQIASAAEKGAPLFARAQKYYRLVKQEFEGKGAIERLSHNKLNSSDPKLAADSVVSSIVSPTTSKLDTQNIMRRIQRSKNRDAIIADLRGNIIDHIFERATKGVGKDIEGNAVPSFSGIKAALKPLEDQKKLDILFSPQERDLLHRIVITADSLYNEPALAKNYSGTYYGLAGEMKRLSKKVAGKVPGLNALAEHLEEQARLAKAKEAINPDPKKLQKELKAIQKNTDKVRSK